MKLTGKVLSYVFVVFALAATPAFAAQGDVYAQFANEDIKPYIKIMDGPWVGNTMSGGSGNYRVTVKVPKNCKYVLGLFDNKVGRSGGDERSAVVLVDGVNPLAPAETVPLASIDGADVSALRKYPFDGITFNSRDTSGKDCFVKVVDAKEEYAVGAVQPFAVPAGRSGSLGRIDVFIFAAPAYPPVVGQAVQYGAPVLRYSIFLEE